MLRNSLISLALGAGLVFAAAPAAAGHHEGANIVETAQEAGSFTTLIAAAQAADLAETLSEGGPFTVFAPTDEAFAKALDALGITAEELLADKPQLKAILLYHVIEGRVKAGDLAGKSLEVATLNGAKLAVDATGDGVQVGGASVVSADVEASNGVIHVIDGVLLP